MASGAPRVDIKLRRDSVLLSFNSPEVATSLLREGLAEDRHSPRAWWNHLSACLQAALSSRPRSLTLRCGNQCWSWPEEVSAHGESPTGEILVCLNAHPRSWLASLLPNKNLAHLQNELASRCALCPIPVVVDGRTINHLSPEQLPKLRGELPDENGGFGYRWLSESFCLDPNGFCLSSPILRGAGEIIVGGKRVEGVNAKVNVDAKRPESASAAMVWDRVTSTDSSRDPVTVVRTFDGDFGGEVVEQTCDLERVERNVFAGVDWSCALPLGFTVGLKNGFVPSMVVNRVSYWAVRASLLQAGFSQPIPEYGCSASHRFPAVRVGQWVGVSSLAQEASYLMYVQDGVLLNPIQVDTAYQGTVGIINRPTMSVDMTLLEVVQDSQVEEDVRWLCSQEQTLVNQSRSAILNRYGSLRIPLAVQENWRWG